MFKIANFFTHKDQLPTHNLISDVELENTEINSENIES